jgi:hypothetical protein
MPPRIRARRRLAVQPVARRRSCAVILHQILTRPGTVGRMQDLRRHVVPNRHDELHLS